MSNAVFISYSHIDHEFATAICHYFENEKIRCWMAPRDILPGANWAESIAAAIPSCRLFLLVFSSNSNLSRQVLREVELAVASGLLIVPVKIENIMPTGGMSYYLSTVHWIDIVDQQTEKKLNMLCDAVKRLLNNANDASFVSGQGFPSNAPVSGKRRQRRSIGVWAATAFVVLTAITLLFVFRNNLFHTPAESPDATETVTPAVVKERPIVPTPLPSPSSGSEAAAITPDPTPTVDPDIAPDTVVNIPDIVLKTCILKTLNAMNIPVQGNIVTVADMRKLTSLSVSSDADEMYSFFGSTEFVERMHLYPIIMKSGITTLEGLQYAENLEYLSLCSTGLEDIGALSQIYNLVYLDLGFNNISDISALEGMGRLEGLILRQNNISNIDPLLLLYNVNTLDISRNPIEDLLPLSDMSQLENLSIRGLNISSFEGIESLVHLEQILAQGNPITDIEALRNLKNIRILELDNTQVEDISALASINMLQEVNLLFSNVTDISPLRDLKNLKLVFVSSEVQDINPDTVELLQNRGCTFSGSEPE